MPATPLKRSVINRSIEQAKETLRRFGIALPPFAFLSVPDWERCGPEWNEVRDCMLGWDVTDFGSGRFEQIGRTLFTLRNGTTRKPGYAKTYAEKLLFDPEIQRAPAHFHRAKMEDICCRAGGNVVVQFTGTNPDDSPSNQPIIVKVDGVATRVEPRGIVRLRPVLITVGATVLGLFPLLLHGGPLWEPMCYAQIGGLTIATAITLLLVPVLYAIFVEDLKIIRWQEGKGGEPEVRTP